MGVKGSEIDEYDLKNPPVSFVKELDYSASGLGPGIILLYESARQKGDHASMQELDNRFGKKFGKKYLLEIDVLRGVGAKVIDYALQNRPTDWSSPTHDLNFAFRICLEIARYVLMPLHACITLAMFPPPVLCVDFTADAYVLHAPMPYGSG